MPVRDLAEKLDDTIQVRLPHSQTEWLDRVTELHAVNRSALIRYAISLLIQTYGSRTDDLVEDVAVEIHDLKRLSSRGSTRGS